MVGETGAPGENTHKSGENMETAHTHTHTLISCKVM